MNYQVLSVNVGQTKTIRIGGKSIQTAIIKRAVVGPVSVQRLGLLGDEQADLTVHGGLAKAVYAYPVSHYEFWQQRQREHIPELFDQPLPYGFLGENLTLNGPLEADLFLGDELHFPDCVLRVSEPRQPCFKFTAVMGYARAAKDMVEQGMCGYYLRVDRPGTVAAGQSFELRPGRREVSVAQAFAAQMRR